MINVDLELGRVPDFERIVLGDLEKQGFTELKEKDLFISVHWTKDGMYRVVLQFQQLVNSCDVGENELRGSVLLSKIRKYCEDEEIFLRVLDEDSRVLSLDEYYFVNYYGFNGFSRIYKIKGSPGLRREVDDLLREKINADVGFTFYDIKYGKLIKSAVYSNDTRFVCMHVKKGM